MSGKAKPLNSVEETAIENIQAIKVIQPKGPYRLIGHSYGGVLAFEMCRMLLEQGETIESLVLLDSFASSFIQQQKPFDDLTMLYEVSKALANIFGKNLSLNAKHIQRLAESKRLEYVSNELVRQGIAISGEQFIAFYNVFKANQHCYHTYKPLALDDKINVSLYRASERHQSGRSVPADYGWNALLPDPVQVHDIRANHFSMLNKDHVQQLVRLIRDPV